MRKDRRDFLSGLGQAGARWRRARGSRRSATRRRAAGRRASDSAAAGDRADFDRRVLGSFLEHLGRAIYTGVYQPGSPLADANGFRTDVVREVKELGVPIVRYPGRQLRLRLQLAGRRRPEGAAADRPRSGVELDGDEPVRHQRLHRVVPADRQRAAARDSTSAPARAEMAVALVEYCNVERGTKWSDLRRSHGYAQPHGVQLLVPGQRDGRPVADRAAAGARVRPQGARRGASRCASSTATCS